MTTEAIETMKANIAMAAARRASKGLPPLTPTEPKVVSTNPVVPQEPKPRPTYPKQTKHPTCLDSKEALTIATSRLLKSPRLKDLSIPELCTIIGCSKRTLLYAAAGKQPLSALHTLRLLFHLDHSFRITITDCLY